MYACINVLMHINLYEGKPRCQPPRLARAAALHGQLTATDMGLHVSALSLGMCRVSRSLGPLL